LEVSNSQEARSVPTEAEKVIRGLVDHNILSRG